MKGAEIGLASMAASLVIATGAGIQWMQRTNSAAEIAEGEAASGVIRGIRPCAARVPPKAAKPNRSSIRSSTPGCGGRTPASNSASVRTSTASRSLLLWLVAFISLLVLSSALDYVRDDRRYTHFFAAMTLFSGGMLIMVMAENMVQLILGWEIMGLTSFLLIGHWWEEEANSRAALKAFFTVRVGDVGLLVGTAILFFGANQWAVDNLDTNGFNIGAIQAWALSGEGPNTQFLLWRRSRCSSRASASPASSRCTPGCPTPWPAPRRCRRCCTARRWSWPACSSSLASTRCSGRASTSATAGCRSSRSSARSRIVIAALLAFVQDDIKKVLAYSTVSQLGYMMLGLGTGAWLPAVFHIFTHAFFKCCLFLCAGSISHSGSHHSFDMKKDMGGLRKNMPVTFAAWIVSTLALTGVFPFAGFWSKDEIIDNVGAQRLHVPVLGRSRSVPRSPRCT